MLFNFCQNYVAVLFSARIRIRIGGNLEADPNPHKIDRDLHRWK